MIVTITCKILPYEVLSGSANMALDEALLDRVCAEPDGALLRTYGWSLPTLSLGYFQHLTQALAETRWQTVPLVRRPTGGGAIWHHHEITYALVLPIHHPQARPSSVLYRVVHSAIAEVIRSQGMEIQARCPESVSTAGDRRRWRPFLCFQDSDPEDLVVCSSKVVGSAQRKRARAILQHGSILLRRSQQTPELPGICDLARVPQEPAFWAEAIERAIVGALGLAPVPCAQTSLGALRQHAATLEQAVYQTQAWTARRP